MADRPILFSGPMVRALLAGTKTQTRRTLKSPYGTLELAREGWKPVHTKVFPGDRLWVREAWRCNGWASDLATIFYAASEGDGYTAMCEQYPVADKKPLRITAGWRPSIHMPRWASRLTLTVTDVRVERLQDISEADAIAEGIHGIWDGTPFTPDPTATNKFTVNIGGGNLSAPTAAGVYRMLWEWINGDGSWDANPWVVAYSFSVERQNIDLIERAA